MASTFSPNGPYSSTESKLDIYKRRKTTEEDQLSLSRPKLDSATPSSIRQHQYVSTSTSTATGILSDSGMPHLDKILQQIYCQWLAVNDIHFPYFVYYQFLSFTILNTREFDNKYWYKYDNNYANIHEKKLDNNAITYMAPTSHEVGLKVRAMKKYDIRWNQVCQQ